VSEKILLSINLHIVSNMDNIKLVFDLKVIAEI